MKKPSGWTVSGFICGGLLGMTGMAISQPSPTLPSQPLLGVVHPAPVTEYRDKIVYRAPQACLDLQADMQANIQGTTAYDQKLGEERDRLNDLFFTASTKNTKKLEQQMKDHDAWTASLSDDGGPLGQITASELKSENDLAKCQRAVKHQTP